MTGAVQAPDPDVIGYLDGRGVPRVQLDQRLARLRSGPRSGLLPIPGSAEDRQLIRWVAQVILTEELCVAEADRLGLPAVTATGAAGAVAAVELGSILAAAWANNGAVRAVFAHVTAAVQVDEAEVGAYRRAKARPEPARWLLRHRLDDGETTLLGPVCGEELPTAISAELDHVPIGTAFEVVDRIGRHTVIVDAWWPAREPDGDDDVGAQIHEHLLAPARRAAFVRWLDAARTARVVHVAGLEHPGDPHQPDNHHKH
jgi:[acyl-carrier-protein] S-malonyltransferase